MAARLKEPQSVAECLPHGVEDSSTLRAAAEDGVIADGGHVRSLFQWSHHRSQRNHLTPQDQSLDHHQRQLCRCNTSTSTQVSCKERCVSTRSYHLG